MRLRPERPLAAEGKTADAALLRTKLIRGVERIGSDKGTFWLGLTLLAAFLLQNFSGLHWPWLSQLQTDKTYKQLSGFALLTFVAHQWHFSLLRARGLTRKANTLMDSHKFVGSLAPVFFYAHSQQFGYAYLSTLSLVFFAGFLSGLVHSPITHVGKPRLYALWITTHVGLSAILLPLLGYHIYISYAYR